MFDRLSGVLAKITLGLFFLLLFCAGVLIGGTALHDPDTCWIVALGKWMFEHGSIPTIEPFSYTFAAVHRPLVLYQWLTELTFFLAVKAGGLTALLATISLLVMIAFVVIPLKLFDIARVRWSSSLAITLLATVAASFHFLARPEIISYVLLSALLFLLTTHRLARNDTGQPLRQFQGKTIILVALIMVAWANFHTGFVSGLIVLAAYFFADTISRIIFKVQPKCDLTVLAALAAGAVSTFLNPYGVGLWQYIPSLFFASFNHLIKELNSVDVSKAEFAPFLLFLSIFVFASFNQLKAVSVMSASASVSKRRMQLFESLVIFAICVFEGWSHLRLIPFVVLVFVNELAILLSPDPNHEPQPGLFNLFDSKLAEGLAPPLRLGSAACAALVLIVGVGGTLLTSLKIQPPVLPQSGGAFCLPVKALEIVTRLKTDGQLLNDPQFGDALIWYHPDQPKVFIDTRFDMYGEKLVSDYLLMTRAEPGWQQMIDKYNIKTVFMAPSEQLVQKLQSDPAWHVDYLDKKSIVLSKP